METSTSVAPASTCAECRAVFPTDEMIRYEDVFVCGNCKPVFMQKLAEGAAVRTSKFNYARIGRRVIAALLDSLLLYVVNTAIQLGAGLSFMQIVGFEARPQAGIGIFWVLYLVQIGTACSYETFFIGKYGATLGKMAAKIHVVTADGARLSYLRAVGRHFAKYLSGLTLTIGYLMAFFDREKRSLHDRICNTRVLME